MYNRWLARRGNTDVRLWDALSSEAFGEHAALFPS